MPGIPPKSTPMVDRPWDGPSQVAKLPNPVGEKTARLMYAWESGDGNPNVKASYHFPHHEVSDTGKVGPANMAGVRIGLSRVPQAHIPESERAGARAHLQRHLDDWHRKQGSATDLGGTVSAVSEGSDMSENATVFLPLYDSAGNVVGKTWGDTITTAGTNVAVFDVTDATDVPAEKPWSGILAIVGSPTGDNRYLMPGEISNRDLPIPLQVQLQTGEGHDGAFTAGRIDSIEFIPLSEFDVRDEFNLDGVNPDATIVFGQGTLDGSEAATEAERLIANGAGISIDLPPDRMALIDPKTFEEVDPAEVDMADVLSGKYLTGVGGKIAAATIVTIPAFEQAEIGLEEDSVLVASAHGMAVADVPLPAESAQAAADRLWALTDKALVDDGATRMTGTELAELLRPGFIASAAPLKPDADWFTDPQLKKLTPLTITPEGRVYGHLADWDGCHTGFSNVCVPPFRSQTDYAYFNTGEIECEDGSLVSCGKLMFSMDGGKHASTRLSAAEASQHYDDSTKVGAFVRAGTDQYGTWLAGALRPGLSDEEVQHLRSHPPSGDWRPIVGKGTELVAAFAVAVGGFPIPRAMVASGANGELTIISAPLDLELGPHAIRRRFELARRKRKSMRPYSDDDQESSLASDPKTKLGTELEAKALFRDFPSATRKRMAKAGTAMPDGSFPIANCEDAANARQAVGRTSPGKRAAVKAHIAKREKALGCSSD